MVIKTRRNFERVFVVMFCSNTAIQEFLKKRAFPNEITTQKNEKRFTRREFKTEKERVNVINKHTGVIQDGEREEKKERKIRKKNDRKE